MKRSIDYHYRAFSLSRLTNSGFTIIEILIAIAIVGILAAIAYPSYGQYMMEGRRADAQLALLQAIQTLERCQSTRYSYGNCTLSATTSPEKFYNLSLESTNTSYTVTATATGTQANDTACLEFSIDHRGQQSPDPDSSDCWP